MVNLQPNIYLLSTDSTINIHPTINVIINNTYPHILPQCSDNVNLTKEE